MACGVPASLEAALAPFAARLDACDVALLAEAERRGMLDDLTAALLAVCRQHHQPHFLGGLPAAAGSRASGRSCGWGSAHALCAGRTVGGRLQGDCTYVPGVSWRRLGGCRGAWWYMLALHS